MDILAPKVGETICMKDLDQYLGQEISGKFDSPLVRDGHTFIGFAQLPSGARYLIEENGVWHRSKERL
jgi:hypothetical protein